jgi:hypothetical protein
VDARSIAAGSLTLRAGSVLSLPPLTSTTPETLSLNVTGTLTIETGASIDVSARGYPASGTYPGAIAAGGNNGGSHLAYGGHYNGPPGSVFGSVYRPQEGGGGASGGSPGGGIVRIVGVRAARSGSRRPTSAARG